MSRHYRAMLIPLLLLTATPQAVADGPVITDIIGLAADGLNAQIEDDVNPGGDIRLVSMKTTGCKTELIGDTRKWTIDWTKTEMVAPGDTFVFIDVPPVKLAIVGDTSIPDQAAKLGALFRAMLAAEAKCKVR
jgi:hypothetical protein